ncbi:TPA: hypothetical protein NG682_005098 [Vibrio parahaemolyticus]|nr:hypothetical protein [Vibrio parahaemolyticus]HCE3706275.1 hypothetical protein [Vibrio parahaemolyticus]
MKDFKESTKESNLYFINAAELDFPTEKEFQRFYAQDTIDNSCCLPNEMREEFGEEYDMDDKEVYEHFKHLAHEQFEKSRKEMEHIVFDKSDLINSLVVETHNFGKQHKTTFEYCSFEISKNILEGLEYDFEEFDIDSENSFYTVIAFQSNNTLFFKYEDNVFTKEELLEYLKVEEGLSDENYDETLFEEAFNKAIDEAIA